MNPPVAGLERAAIEALYLRLERPIYNVALRSVWSEEEAADVVHEAFVRLWAMRARVRPETVEPLLWRIALNLCAKRRRWRRIRTFLGLSAVGATEDPSAEDALGDHQRELALRRAVEALPADLRDVILLTTYAELSYDEVGRLLGIPPGTIGSRRNRAIRRLRAALNTEPGRSAERVAQRGPHA